MSYEKVTLPGVSDENNALLNGLLEQLDKKAQRNLLRASYYDGKRAIRQVGTIIPPQYYRLGIVLGWSAKAVDILARRCNLDDFVWTDGDLSSLGGRDLWDDNYLGSEVSSALISSLIHGTSFLVNTRGEGDEPESLIHVKDALSATGEWNPRTRRLDNLVSITARDSDGRASSLALYLDGLTITAEKGSTLGSGWSVNQSPHPWGVPAEPLVYKPRVGRPFGSSRISRPVMSISDQAVRTVIRMEGHADVFSFPEMWLLGADESIFKNPDGSQKASWQVMLGRMKGIPDDEDATNPRADVKQFSSSSPQPHIDQLEMQASLFAGETDLPVTALGVQAKTNTTTADGSDNAERQLVAEAEGAIDDWAPALRRAYVRGLAIKNGLDAIPDEWKSIDSKFRSPMYLSRAAQADAGMKQLTAVPWLAESEVGLELLGLSEQQIQRALADKLRTTGTGRLSDILQRTAQATDVNTDPAA